MPSSEYFVHPAALVESTSIGKETRIWAFAHVMEGAMIGSGCNVGDHSFIERGVRIGNDVTIKNGVSVWEGVTIEDGAFIGPNACFTNDLRPRSRVYHEEIPQTLVGVGASIGANATIGPGVTLGKYCLIGAGAVVTRDVKPFELVTGVPARHAGWVSRSGKPLEFVEERALEGPDAYELRNDGVTLITK